MQHAKVTKNVLYAAAALLARGWTTGTCARRADNWPVSALDPEACRWCADGAIQRAAAKARVTCWTALRWAGQEVRNSGRAHSLSGFNDHVAQDVGDVIDMLHQAAERSRRSI